MSFFESIRRANLDFYTAHPLEWLTEEQLADLAQREGLSVDELKQRLSTPHAEMTCPLCGRASTHLVGCKGCGGGSFGFEMEAAHGQDAQQRLREDLTLTLQTQGQPAGVVWDEQQIGQAVNNAYQMGGCMICADCWHHTLPHEAYRSCPLFLHHERTLETDRAVPFQDLLLAAFNGEKPREWLQRVFTHWTVAWNTAGQDEAERTAIAAWRSTILHGALRDPEAFADRTNSVNDEIKRILGAMGLEDSDG